MEQLADLSPEDLENISGIGSKTIEKLSEILSDFYAQQPSYQDDLERLAAEHMFAKDDTRNRNRSCLLEGGRSEQRQNLWPKKKQKKKRLRTHSRKCRLKRRSLKSKIEDHECQSFEFTTWRAS